MSQYVNYSTITSVTSTVVTIAKGTIVASTGISLLLSGLLYFKQSSLIYPRFLPEGARTEVPTPDEVDIQDWETVELKTKDGETLSSYLLKAVKPQGITVLFMHGNAGNIGHRLPIAKVFSDQMGCNMLMLSYRGYGLSTGKPSEKGLLIDAQTALDWILSHPDLKSTRVIIYGQSLGGALAIQLATKNQDRIHGLMLENTFRSMRTLIPSAFPPAKYLARFCHQIWPSESTIGGIETLPVLFLSGEKDELVPPAHMKTLFNLTRARKVWRSFPNGSHNDTVSESGYFEAIYEFLLAIKNDKLERMLTKQNFPDENISSQNKDPEKVAAGEKVEKAKK